MRKLVLFAAFVLMGVGLVAVPSPAHAATPVSWAYDARTGATYIKVLDGKVQSDLTAQSYVSGGAKSSSHKNSTAAVKILDLAAIGAVETSTDAVVTGTGDTRTTTLTSAAKAARVSLLGGLITADAVETKISTTGKADGTGSYTAKNQLLGLKIAGINLPVTIPDNYAVTIPGVASVTLNYTLHGKVDRLIGTMGWAIGITLLQPLGSYSAGVTLLVNPVNQYLSEVDPASGAGMTGMAYGTRVDAHAGSDVTIVSDPTAFIGTPAGSSQGKTIENTLAGVNVPGVLTAGAVKSTTTSTKDAFGNAEIVNTNETAGINLLGGLIRADAIKVTAGGKLQDGKWTSTMELKLVNLVVAGQTIPINVSPNTSIDVAGLGKVTLNEQLKSTAGAYQNIITGLKVTLDTSKAGLPVGAVVELGVAYTAIAPAG